MHKDAVLALRTRDNSLAKEVKSTDNEVDRFNLYVIRLLKTAIQNPRLTREIGLLNGKDCLGYRLVTKSVERTADHAVNIAENVLMLKRDLNNDIVEKIEKMSTAAIKMFDTAIESLFREDYNAAESVMEGIKEIVTLEKEAVGSSQMAIEDAANLRLVIESVRRTAEYACDIAEIVLNLTVDSILV
jgi:phosphate uptake regulator